MMRLHCLVELVLDDIPNMTGNNITTCPSNLKIFEISKVSEELYRNYDFFNALFSTNLTHFKLKELSSTSWCVVSSLPSSIKEVTLRSCWELNDENMSCLFANAHNMINFNHFEVSYCNRFTGLGQVGLFPPAIRSIVLYGCFSMTDQGLRDLFSSNLPNLTSLTLSYMTKITFNLCDVILPASLTHLCFSMNTMISNNGYVRLFSSNQFPNLTSLEFHYPMDSFTGVGMNGLLPSSLLELDLSHCSPVSYEGMMDLLSNNLRNLKFLNIMRSQYRSWHEKIFEIIDNNEQDFHPDLRIVY
eukprot:gene13584-18233_t